MDSPIIRVVAAVIERDGRYLVGLRPTKKRHGGLWEFPGGKMMPDEDLLAAATRELAEELDLDVEGIGALLWTGRDAGSPYVIDFVEVTTLGEPEALEHQRIGWFLPSKLAEMPLAPSDAAFVGWLIG